MTSSVTISSFDSAIIKDDETLLVFWLLSMALSSMAIFNSGAELSLILEAVVAVVVGEEGSAIGESEPGEAEREPGTGDDLGLTLLDFSADDGTRVDSPVFFLRVILTWPVGDTSSLLTPIAFKVDREYFLW